MVAVLLAVGCTGQAHTENPASNATVAVTSAPTVVTTARVMPIETACPLPANRSYWIKINPIDKIERGDKIHINGTTNIPAGKLMELEIYESSMHSHCKCCFDDYLSSMVKVQKGERCINTFSLYFDSTNTPSQEYLITATYPENISVTNSLVFNLLVNTTPLIFQNGAILKNNSTHASFALLPIDDIRRGNIQTVQGIRKGTEYAIEYSIREARYGSDCTPISPWCQGEKIFGIIHPVTFGSDSSRFAIRFDTVDFEPGQYVIDLDFTCSDATTKGWFNVTPNIPGTS
jgi:hypothetical protein